MPDIEHLIQNVIKERFKLTNPESEVTGPLMKAAERQLREQYEHFPDEIVEPPLPLSEEDLPPNLLSGISLQELLDAPLNIPSAAKPAEFLRTLSTEKNPDRPSVCSAFGSDPKLAASLLRLANKPRFGTPGEVDTISRSVSLIGSRQSVLLAVGTLPRHGGQKVPAERFDLHNFWRHSLASAFLCRKIGLHMKAGKGEPFYVTGLIHDLGLVILAGSVPEIGDQVLKYGSLLGLPISDAERKLLGFDHAVLGASLFKAWGLPGKMVLAIGEHHTPSEILSPMGSALLIADAMSKAFGFGTRTNLYVEEIPVHHLQACALSASSWPEFVFEALRETTAFLRLTEKRLSSQ